MLIEKTFNVNFKIKFKGNEDDLSKLQKIIDHHIDQLLNLDEFPEITSVYDASIKEIHLNKNCNDDEKGDNIVFENALSPEKYLEFVTGKTYANIDYRYDLRNDEERIAQILKENGKEDYSDYPLSEAYMLYEDMNKAYQFVLVELLDYQTGNKYYRFYQY